jgi:hypothetical protein
VCLKICAHVCINACICVCTYIQMCVCMYVCMNVRMWTLSRQKGFTFMSPVLSSFLDTKGILFILYKSTSFRTTLILLHKSQKVYFYGILFELPERHPFWIHNDPLCYLGRVVTLLLNVTTTFPNHGPDRNLLENVRRNIYWHITNSFAVGKRSL